MKYTYTLLNAILDTADPFITKDQNIPDGTEKLLLLAIDRLTYYMDLQEEKEPFVQIKSLLKDFPKNDIKGLTSAIKKLEDLDKAYFYTQSMDRSLDNWWDIKTLHPVAGEQTIGQVETESLAAIGVALLSEPQKFSRGTDLSEIKGYRHEIGNSDNWFVFNTKPENEDESLIAMVESEFLAESLLLALSSKIQVKPAWG